MRLLIVEDNPQLSETLAGAFTAASYSTAIAASLEQARERLREAWPDFILLDANFPTASSRRAEFNAGAFLDLLGNYDYPAPSIILMSGEDSTAFHFPEVCEWLTTGRIADILPKNMSGGWAFLKVLLVHRVEILRSLMFHANWGVEEKDKTWLYRAGIVSLEEEMFRIAGRIQRIVSRTDNSTHLLITGASGSGKAMFARAIHGEMQRKLKPKKLPFVTVSCRTLGSDTAASELLGSVPGAFTGARPRIGYLENARDGVLLLDDIHLLPKDVYGVLLGAFQEGIFKRVGSNEEIHFRARVVSTTNVPLVDLERDGLMPDEFYNRIARDTIVIPTLSQRSRDIEPLMRHFLSQHHQTSASMPRDFDDEVVRAFQGYTWPGDVRELENCVQSIYTHVSERVVTIGALRALCLHYKGRKIEWDSAPIFEQELDIFLLRFGWRGGWSKLGGEDFELVRGWLCDLFPTQAEFIISLSQRVESQTNPKPIHYLKALLFLGTTVGGKANHAQLMKILGLQWDYTNRVLCKLAGTEAVQSEFQPAPLVRHLEAGKWVYSLGPAFENPK